ncbi:MAG: hypothetical protein SFY68_06100 [Candidatus Sumerlaeia bacterium]|nr:hypothetical protein [Candidatus Sumerlaeia bacterium]
MRTFFLLFLLLWVTNAQASRLTINAIDDNGGYYRPGAWVPIIISVSNQPGGGSADEPFNGRAIVETTSFSSNQGSYEFVRDISVPVSSTKRFVLYARMAEGTGSSIKVVIRRANNQLVQEIPLQLTPLKNSELFTLVVSSSIQSVNLPTLRTAIANTRLNAFRSPEFLPEHWAGYDTADVVVFPGWPTGRMNSRAIAALRDWVNAGGVLYLLGGAETASFSDEAALEFLPVELNGTQIVRPNADLARFEPVPQPDANTILISNATPLPESVTLSDASGGIGSPMPVAVVKEMGLGKVVFLASDLKMNSRALQEMLAPAWFATIPVQGPIDWQTRFEDHIGEKLVYVTGRSARPPSAVLIILICICYMLVVGPVNFFILSKMDRIQLAWITVPGIVFLFSIVIYGIGTITKGGKTIVREASLYLGKQNSPDFSVESYIGVLTPDSISLEIKPLNPAHTIADHDRWYEIPRFFGYIPQIVEAPTVTTGDRPRIITTDEGVEVGAWPLRTFGFKRFQLRGLENRPGGVESTVRYRSDETEKTVWLEGELRNQMGLDFLDSAVFFGTMGVPLGEFNSGETKALGKGNSRWIEGGETNSMFHWRNGMESILPKADDASVGESSEEELSTYNSLRMAEGIFKQEQLERLLPATKGKVYFVGIAEEKELSFNINLDRDEGSRSILVVVELNPVPETGTRFWVPDQLVQASLVNIEMLSQSGGSFAVADTSKGAAMEMYNSAGVFVTELPFHGEGVRIEAALNKSRIDSTPAEQTVSQGVLGIRPGVESAVLQQQPVLDFEGKYFTPYNGRGWLLILSDVPRDSQGNEVDNGGGFNMDRNTLLRGVGLTLLGTVGNE